MRMAPAQSMGTLVEDCLILSILAGTRDVARSTSAAFASHLTEQIFK